MKTKSNTNGKVKNRRSSQEAVERPTVTRSANCTTLFKTSLTGMLDKPLRQSTRESKTSIRKVTQTEKRRNAKDKARWPSNFRVCGLDREITWMDASFVLGIAFASALEGRAVVRRRLQRSAKHRRPIRNSRIGHEAPKTKQPKDRIDTSSTPWIILFPHQLCRHILSTVNGYPKESL